MFRVICACGRELQHLYSNFNDSHPFKIAKVLNRASSAKAAHQSFSRIHSLQCASFTIHFSSRIRWRIFPITFKLNESLQLQVSGPKVGSRVVVFIFFIKLTFFCFRFSKSVLHSISYSCSMTCNNRFLREYC